MFRWTSASKNKRAKRANRAKRHYRRSKAPRLRSSKGQPWSLEARSKRFSAVQALWGISRVALDTTKTVYDRCHIMREMTRMVGTVRKQEHRAFEASRELSTYRRGPSGTRKAGGFRNAQHFTTATCFHCGGLDLQPH